MTNPTPTPTIQTIPSPPGLLEAGQRLHNTMTLYNVDPNTAALIIQHQNDHYNAGLHQQNQPKPHQPPEPTTPTQLLQNHLQKQIHHHKEQIQEHTTQAEQHAQELSNLAAIQNHLQNHKTNAWTDARYHPLQPNTIYIVRRITPDDKIMPPLLARWTGPNEGWKELHGDLGTTGKTLEIAILIPPPQQPCTGNKTPTTYP